MSTNQEYWDACLIKSWRTSSNLLHAIQMFENITGKLLNECDLLRKPPVGFPWKVGVRVFVASYLPKVNDYLWDHDCCKDVELLKKLQKSSYTTLCKPIKDKSLDNTRKNYYKNMQKVILDNNKYGNRNHNTDWNVVK